MQRLLRWVHLPNLPTRSEDLREEHVPRAQTVEEQLLTAAYIQRDIHGGKRTLVCAVCACFVGSNDVCEDGCSVSDLPGLELLDASEPATDELPRSGVTHLMEGGVKYCLSPEGVTSEPGQPTRLRVCQECWDALTRKKPAVPPRSLVRVDTGPWPTDQHGPLPRPTHVEELLLSSAPPLRRIFVMRPAHGGGCGVSKKELTGHVVVVPGTSVEQLGAMLLPRTLDELPEYLTVGGKRGLLTAVRRNREAPLTAATCAHISPLPVAGHQTCSPPCLVSTAVGMTERCRCARRCCSWRPPTAVRRR
jgi:hypothetical protein